MPINKRDVSSNYSRKAITLIEKTLQQPKIVQKEKQSNNKYSIKSISTFEKQGINKVKIIWYSVIIINIKLAIKQSNRNPIKNLKRLTKLLYIYLT